MNKSCGIYRFSFNCPFSQCILFYLEKESEILAFIFLIRESSRGETNCENFCEASYELVNLSHRDFAESKEFRASLYTDLHCAKNRSLWRSKIKTVCESLNVLRMERYQRKKEKRKR